jgi:hypothetical protein
LEAADGSATCGAPLGSLHGPWMEGKEGCVGSAQIVSLLCVVPLKNKIKESQQKQKRARLVLEYRIRGPGNHNIDLQKNGSKIRLFIQNGLFGFPLT